MKTIADAVAETLLGAVLADELSAGQALDLARRIAEASVRAGVDLDEVLELSVLGTRL